MLLFWNICLYCNNRIFKLISKNIVFVSRNILVNKLKIINDPVYGFIKIPFPFIYDIIQHKYFQRLRGIKQLGLTSLVYPGAMHNRFQHAVGAMHLMSSAISVLTAKGINISQEESDAAHLAILLHDIGHGPFSHVLESSLVEGVSHEDISIAFINKFNKFHKGKLDMAMAVFRDKYSKRFLHQLVSSQLDMDRLDYLRRDSFFTGVTEGIIGSDRIIKMLQVKDDQLVVESKGIYSIEKFLIARRLMYWQVYLHKTAIVAEKMLVKLLQRARFLTQKGVVLFGSPQLLFFLKNDIVKDDFFDDKNESLENFAMLDDGDIMSAIKVWSHQSDFILSRLSEALLCRDLLHIEIRKEAFNKELVKEIKHKVRKDFGLEKNSEASYFVYSDVVENHAYSVTDDKINILYSDGTLKDVSKASDILNLSVLSKNVRKFVLCYPKSMRTWVMKKKESL